LNITVKEKTIQLYLITMAYTSTSMTAFTMYVMTDTAHKRRGALVNNK